MTKEYNRRGPGHAIVVRSVRYRADCDPPAGTCCRIHGVHAVVHTCGLHDPDTVSWADQPGPFIGPTYVPEDFAQAD